MPIWIGSKWVWWAQQKRGKPLLTDEMVKNSRSWWFNKLKINPTSNQVAMQFDNFQNLYLKWSRYGEAYYTDKLSVFRIPGAPLIELNPPTEHAVVVLNSKREAIGYLPWKSAFLGPQDEWIFPVPDGSGFYRQEFGEKSLNIYWHPLPNFKAATKAKPRS